MIFHKKTLQAILLLSAIDGTAAHLRGGLVPNNTTRALQTCDGCVYPIGVPDTDSLLDMLEIPDNAAEIGAWSTLNPYPIVAVHSAVMPNGKVLTYGSAQNQKKADARTLVFWDPRKGYSAKSLNVIPNAENVDSFCSSGNWLSDGSFLASGGSVAAGTALESLLVDYANEAPSRGTDLLRPRWYGTMTKLADSRVVMTGGTDFKKIGFGGPSATPEVFGLGEGWSLLNGATSKELFSDNGRWWYPHQWLSPSGTVFGISINKMWEMDVNGGGSIRTIGDFKTLPNANTKPNVGGSATAVMYSAGKILQVGGNGNTQANPSSDQASIFDINNIANGDVKVTETSTMNIPRRYADATVLPDGKVLVNGGSRDTNKDGPDAVLESEIWDPKTGQWQLGPPAAVYRGYHSSTVLLPSGGVFTTGGGMPGPVAHLNQQVYFPPYFFAKSGGSSLLAPRPKILSVSSNSLNYNDVLKLQLNSGFTISEVSFIALPAVTHGFDSNQRRSTLPFVSSPVGVDVAIPASRNIVPPGYYYLSVVDTSGVPSPAVIVALESAAPIAATDDNESETVEPTATLINGSFEANVVSTGTYETVDADEVIGWKSVNGEPMEFWNTGFLGVSAPDGNTFLELDARNGFPDEIYQDLFTEQGQQYTISFAIRSRDSGFSTETEKVYVDWCGKGTNTNGYNAEQEGVWSTISISVVGTGDVCRLVLRESLDGNDGRGVLLDNVSFGADDVAPVQTTLINGSFEANAVSTGTWEQVDSATVAGWKSTNGEPMEFWNTGFLGISAPDGNTFLELDARKGLTDEIYQDLLTEQGQQYTINFAIRSRESGFSGETETVFVDWCGEATNIDGYNAEQAGVWSTVSISVVGTGGVCRLLFREALNGNDGFGVLMDNVSFDAVEATQTPVVGSACMVAKCYIRDLDNGTEEEIVASYTYSPLGRYSIRCDTTGSVDYSKWRFNQGEISDDWNSPFWMKNNADDGSGDIWESDYLATCGLKSVTFEARVWSSDSPCASKTLDFEATC